MPDSTKPQTHLLLEILDSWRRFVRLLLLVLCMCSIAAVIAYIVVKHLPSNATTELQFGSVHVLFKQPTKEGDNYLVLVSPHGWERTSILVPDGSNLKIEAGGKVHVDLTGLMVALQARSKAETRVNDLKKKDPKERARCLAPEDCFTKVEMEAIKPIWDWVGPDGALESDMRIANPVRWQRSILPKATYGALIASLNDTDADVSQPGLVDRLSANAFLVKSTYSQKATGNRNGFLYFAVNDVVGPKGSRAKDVDFPDLFFVDNIGAFYVKVSVSPK